MKPFDLHGLKTYDLVSRPSKVFVEDLGQPVGAGAGVGDWIDSLPRQLAGNDLRRVRDHVCRAHRDGRTVVAVDDAQPTLFLIDTEAGRVREEIVLKDVPKAAQIARYAPDNSLIGVTSLNSDTVSLIDPSFRQQTAIKVGSQPMDMAFRGDELFVACQGDGSMHVIDIPSRRVKNSFSAGTGCESVGFF